MDYKQKYLKYKTKYIALKEQSSFAQGSSLKQKYLALKEQSSFTLKNQIGGGELVIANHYINNYSINWQFRVYFKDKDTGDLAGFVIFTEDMLAGKWDEDKYYSGAIASIASIASIVFAAQEYAMTIIPEKFSANSGVNSASVPSAAAAASSAAAPSAATSFAPVSSSTTTTGDSGGNSSASSAAAATTFASSSTTTTTAALAPGAPTLSQADIGLFTAIDAVNLAEVRRIINTGLIPDLNVRSPMHNYFTPLLVACFKLRNLPEGDPSFAALEEITLLLIRSGANVNASHLTSTPVGILDMSNPIRFRTILKELTDRGGVEDIDVSSMYVPPPPPPQ